jgi:hypothetical protein
VDTGLALAAAAWAQLVHFAKWFSTPDDGSSAGGAAAPKPKQQFIVS